MKLTILIWGSFRQISFIYFITCFVFVAWFYTLVLVLHIQFHIVISTCFFYCNFLLFLVVVTTTLIFRLCPNLLSYLFPLCLFFLFWLCIILYFFFLYIFCFVCFIFFFCLFGLCYVIMCFFTYTRFNLTSILSTQV